jgi:hypothetical protein
MRLQSDELTGLCDNVTALHGDFNITVINKD